MDPHAERAVDAIGLAVGVHPGHRAVHAKGTLCSGEFTPAADAAVLSRAPHLAGEPVPAVVRFSNGGGDPSEPDFARDARGIGVKLTLPEGSRADLVGITLPVFFVRTPEDFVEFTTLRKPDPETGQPDMERLGEWLGRHPEAGPAIQAALTAPPPASYARVGYHCIHAYRLVAADGAERFARFSFEPEEGVEALSQDEAEAMGPDYLQEEVRDRLAAGPFGFRLVAQLAERGDPTDDPTAAWPEERERETLGRLEITGLDDTRERDGDILVFDPSRVPDGIELSDDPILHFRPHAYSVSVERRSGAPSPYA